MAEGLRLLAEQSEDVLSLREIARNVGVSQTSVYRHFSDKGELLQALSQEGLERMAQAQREASEKAGGGQKGFGAMGRAYVEFALENPAVFRLIFAHPPGHDPMDASSSRISRAMAQLLEAAVALSHPDVDPKVFALQNWSLVHGLAMLMLDGQIQPDPSTIRSVIESHARF